MINAKNIDFFKDLTQLFYDNKYYDLHNDYDCKEIKYYKNTLFFKLKKNEDKDTIFLIFTNAILTEAYLFNNKNINNLTVNILYRGRFEEGEQLLDISSNNQSYFYLEFEEGQKLEFWAENILMEFSPSAEYINFK